MASTTKTSTFIGVSLPVLRSKPAAFRSTAQRARVVCEAKPMEKLAAAVLSSTPAFLAASPVLARVGEPMNTEGTGLIFGINDSSILWGCLIVFGLIWALYASAAKTLGGGEGDDSGLSL